MEDDREKEFGFKEWSGKMKSRVSCFMFWVLGVDAFMCSKGSAEGRIWFLTAWLLVIQKKGYFCGYIHFTFLTIRPQVGHV